MKKITKPSKNFTRIDKPTKAITRIIKLPNKGDAGYTPKKGVDYFDGKTPTKEELIPLIKPLIPQPIKGDKGENGKSFTKAQVKKMVDESIQNELPDLMAHLEGNGKVDVEEAKDGYMLVINGKKHFVPNAVYGPKLRNFIQLGDSPGTYAGAAGKILAVNSTETAIEYITSGGGAVDSVNGQTGVVVLDTSDIAEATDLNYVSDAQLTVIGNTSGTNTGDVTVSDSSEIDLTLTGQQISASIVAGSIDESKLDTSVNASLDLADTAVQPAGLSGYELLSNKATDFTTVNNTLYPTVEAVNNAINTAVIGLLDYRGSYDASVNTFPATGGSGLLGAILKGDFWICSVAGTLGGVAVTAGDLIISLIDTPGQTASNWDLISNELGYVPENVANKVTSISGASTDTQYPSAKLVYDQLALKAPLISPSFTTPSLGVATATSINGATITSGTLNGSVTGTNTGDQTITNSSDATSHTVTLSASGGSVQLVEGTNITLTTGGTGSAGTVTIAASGGSGDVTKVGTPVNNQIGVWTGDGTIEGTSSLTFNSATDTLGIAADGAIAGAGDLYLYSTGGSVLINSTTLDTGLRIQALAGQYAIFDTSAIATTSKTFTFPNTTGTLALTSSNVASSTTLATPRAIYGNNFDGSAALAQVIASTYGGTGNGFTKISGPTTTEKTITIPDANMTITAAAATVLDDTTVGAMVDTLGGASSTGTGGLVRATAPTLAGDITLAENAAILLDPALSADGKYNGITRGGTAGATLAFGDLCYLDPTDSRWELCDANAAAGADGDSRGILGICVLAAAADASPTTMLLYGTVRADTAFPAMTINNPLYVSETAGDITGTQPTTTDAVIRIVGFAFTADEILFCPSPDYITHT